MILKDIITQPPVSTLIQDSCSLKGRPLFLSLIRHYSENGYSIRYFKYDSPLSSETTEMEQLKLSWKTSIVDGNQDLILSRLTLLLNWTVGAIASALRNLQKTTTVSVIALVHGDVHDKHTLQSLNYIFPCHLAVRRAQGCNLCSGTWRKASGKITDSITDKWELKDVKEFIETQPAVMPDSLPKSAVPKSTFKLDLNAREEQARSQVVLPYIKKHNESSSEPSRGKIIYEVEAPDWDDEDPDDDLEI
ncbi:hypothetical protein DAPPUDRAFT_333884 [Daphnia pulex]|uniref:Elongator complex protein 5 n=1 Tax=Daphnia pulex TaxID=6669 RepID=E9HU42_DAPPU|nr:hypothetical protein DAPPUDRAFT_333884 [Daphnia pulex]|eukprot:EFX64735.1 hypothetical protein DAPPUDRAFT_333884 [Daphnia pulex]